MTSAAMPDALNLSLVSHTNVGKTTLLRTLLQRDVGEIADRAHVTEAAEAHVLVETAQGDTLRLWDTPGFGDSARLLRRLRAAENPIGWLASQVWDRLTDRPFFSSQQALRNVRDESDVVLYLVNAAEDPAAAGYVEVEMQILAWIGKPVVLLLNQTGAPRAREAELADEQLWRRQVSLQPGVKAVIGLDAFARCWVQEDALLATVGGVLPAARQAAFGRLRAAWRVRQLQAFTAAMAVLADQLAAAAADREPVGVPGFRQRTSRWLGALLTEREFVDPDVTRAMNALGNRLDASVRETTDRLLGLHGLSGRAGTAILARVAGQFDVARPADTARSGVIGGMVSGALGGLAADLAAGGLTFGAGALIGGVVGVLGGSGAAKAWNLARGTVDGKAGWSQAFLEQRPGAALLRYLAVAHYGRGRGDWVEGEYPPHWQPLVEAVAAEHGEAIRFALAAALHGGDPDLVRERMRTLITAMARAALVRLYPESADLLGTATPESERPDAAAAAAQSPRR